MDNRYLNGDKNLVEDCIAGDAAAWVFFTKKYSPLILISVKNRLRRYGITLNDSELADVRQDVLASIYAGGKLKNVRSKDDISYWLCIVAGNYAVGYVRRKFSSLSNNTVSLEKKFCENGLIEIMAAAGPSPRDEIIQKELLDKIKDAINSLGTKERVAIKLNMLYGKKHREIASMLKMSENTASSHIKRAKEKLRFLLKNIA